MQSEMQSEHQKSALPLQPILNREGACAMASLDDPLQVPSDSDGSDPPPECCKNLFDACNEQHYDCVKRFLQLLDESGGDINDINGSKNKQTALHIAVIKGNVKILVLLIDRNANAFIALGEDKWKKTPLMYACEKEDNYEIVQLLLRKIPKKDESLNIQDKKGFTALHLAASSGYTEIVQALIEHKVDCKKQDKYKRIPMMCACINGHKEVVEMLLKTGYDCSPVTYQREENFATPPHPTSATGETTATHESRFNGNSATGNGTTEKGTTGDGTTGNSTTGDGTTGNGTTGNGTTGNGTTGDGTTGNGATENGTTGNRTTVRGRGNFVSVLMTAINRKQEQIAMAIIESRQVREALEYSFVDKTGKKVDALRKLIKRMPSVAERVFRFCVDEPKPGDKIEKDKEEITFHYEFIDDLAFECYETSCNQSKVQRYDASNHCLNILINSNSSELVKHPLITTLLYLKWTIFAQLLFGFDFFFHLLNVLFITIFATVVYQPGAETCIADNSTLTCDASRQYAAGTFAALVLITSLIKLGLEIVQMIMLKRRYFFDWINYVEVFMAAGSVIFAFIYLYDCFCPESWQWQLGAFCVFLAWIDFIHFLRMLPFFGIYVIMFGVIVQKFLYVVILAILLIMSFAIPFYMLFHDPVNDEDLLTPFKDPGKSIMKTLTMTTGEFDYDTLFRQDYSSGPKLAYGISYFFWILFVSLMPILLANLLTGLAVDDVNEIRENAKIRTLCLWARHLQTVEQLLPMFLYRRHRFQMNKSLKDKAFEIDLEKFPKAHSFKCCTWLGEPYSEFKRWLWFNSLELNHFDTYGNTVLPVQDAMKTDELLKRVTKLTSEMEAMKKNLFEANEEIIRISNKLPN